MRGRGAFLAAWRDLVAALALVTFAAAGLTALEVSDGSARHRVVLPCGASGEMDFVNSVTGSPVTIQFRVCGALYDFTVRTDAAAEEYYTAGLYELGRRLAGERARELSICSEVGVDVRLGTHRYQVRHGCLEVRSKWATRWFGG
ncbi:hypothetical protein U7230_07140 [Carboxydochorda subterranea]|uniref:Uncharacterized protein n=1 Tax=Carboxydichorda subterranea TaxID=3109565 RepID=A0ABZ1C0X8_9FIRM|nr:hypothetical protein [Limnochorda sp. L945t]WRP18759.1 hypothetical protein U7230_07140 [Limnochorda sp. L945t]